MKTAKLLMIFLALAACTQKAPAPDIESTLLADEFCAGNFEPWKAVLAACASEKMAGAPGAQCATMDQIDVVLDQRRRASGFEKCQLVMRWGANASNK